MDNLEEYLNTGSGRIVKQLVERLNTVATEAIRLKKLIDGAKTDLKKTYYRKKLVKTSLIAERIIKSIELLRDKETTGEDSNEKLS